MNKKILRNSISAFVIVVMVASVFALPIFSDNHKVHAASKAKITFNANNGKFTAKKYTKKKSYNKSITLGKKIGKLPNLKRTGYTFKGWYTKKTGGKKVTKKFVIKKNVKLYARWTPKNYNVTYDPQNYSGIFTKLMKFNSTHYTPSLEGYKFAGWYDSKGSKHEKHTVAKDIRLTGKWSASHPLSINLELMNQIGKGKTVIKSEVSGFDYEIDIDIPNCGPYTLQYYKNPDNTETIYYFKDDICRQIFTYTSVLFPNTKIEHDINDYIALYGKPTIHQGNLSKGWVEFKIASMRFIVTPLNDKVRTNSQISISNLSSTESFDLWD